jgi:hypothetical protein
MHIDEDDDHEKELAAAYNKLAADAGKKADEQALADTFDQVAVDEGLAAAGMREAACDSGTVDDANCPAATEETSEHYFRVIAAALHYDGRGDVLPDMINGAVESLAGMIDAAAEDLDTINAAVGMTGAAAMIDAAAEGGSPPAKAEDFAPGKLRIREDVEPLDEKRRKKKRLLTDEQKEKKRARDKAWKKDNPDKAAAHHAKSHKRERAKDKALRAEGPYLVAVDLEGFDTGRYFTDNRPAAKSQGLVERIEAALRNEGHASHLEPEPGDGPDWTEHDHEWYLAQYDLTPDDPIPSARNKKPDAPDIYVEHKPFLFGAGNDDWEFYDYEGDGSPNRKIALSSERLLNNICDLPKKVSHPNQRFISFSFNYDVSEILPDIDAKVAEQLQAGEIVIEGVDEDGAPTEERIEQATHFWNGFAIYFRRGKMLRVGRLKVPDKPYIYIPIKDPEEAQAYIDAGREPVKRKIEYKDASQPVTIEDSFGFFQCSFVEAYEESDIAISSKEKAILEVGKKKRGMMASLPMDEVILYQRAELRVLCRSVNNVLGACAKLGLNLQHLQGAGAISSAMATKHRALDFYPKVQSSNWSDYQDWAHHAMAGGHIQMMKQGRHTGGLADQHEDDLIEAARDSGRPEALGLIGRLHDGERYYEQYGPPKYFFEYDLTSAYPSVQYLLPAMALPIGWETRKDGSLGRATEKIEGEAHWRWASELSEDAVKAMSPYSMFEVEVEFPKRVIDPKTGKSREPSWYPLFYRRDKDKAILLPRDGIVRCYRDELLAAFEWLRCLRPDFDEEQCARAIRFRGGYEYICPTIHDLKPAELKAIKTNCPSARIDEESGLVYPFHYIKTYYEERAKYPKKYVMYQVLKLGINGAWGKTAQSIGGRNGMPPKTASPWVAGVVTATTRAKCVLAALNAPWGIIHIATDGVTTDEQLHVEPYDAEGKPIKVLGSWEMKSFSRGVFMKPGMYCTADDHAAEEIKPPNMVEMLVKPPPVYKNGAKFKGKSRGVSLRSVLGDDDIPDAAVLEKIMSGEAPASILPKRNIHEEYFAFLDEAVEQRAGNVDRQKITVPHKKLITFGAAASCKSKWPRCGNWLETTRDLDLSSAGVKRAKCLDERRARELVITRVAMNDTPKILSARHEPDWLDKKDLETAKILRAVEQDLADNREMKVAMDWVDWGCDFEDGD